MLWYLLYPVRGTSEPPTLSSDHSVRRAFYRHGKTTAQHWLLAMLVSVAVGAGLSYPTIFLSESPSFSLFPSMPHQVWTTAKNYDGDSAVKVDVEMRQIWVHGSSMQALNKDVLKQALDIQQSLVGDDHLHRIAPSLGRHPGKNKLTWGYHSPLMYWNNSAAVLEEDDNVIQTINDQARTSSSMNIALRPASVFATKSFNGRKLQAADALVLTFMNKVGDEIADRWQKQMAMLAQSCLDCTIVPAGNIASDSRVYEFSFIPLSLKENIALAFAYGCVALYVLLSLRRIRAFHSRFGLVVTAITQLTTSILASFTICGILDINLASIPKNAYPFVVLVIGLENMFRLINAILAYPSTMATELRIGHALGDVGPLKIAAAAQNLLILWALSNVVSPGVAAFCAFAAIATLFDTFLLLTFFVAVLSVDIRRLELQDALAKSEVVRKKRRRSPTKRSWFDALVQGRLPFSTRMAGTAVTTTFILSLNYHFFDTLGSVPNIRSLKRLFTQDPAQLPSSDTFPSSLVNATLTPEQWMAMQGFDSAREVLQLVKPGANSFTVRVFSPLTVVLAGADRTEVPPSPAAWTSALRSLALEHLYPFAVVVVFVVTFVAVLMNFLLWNEAADEADTNADRPADSKLSVQTLALPHKLDIIKMSSGSRGQMVTIALDRTIAVSQFDHTQGNYTTGGLSTEVTAKLSWPIQQVIIDDQGDYIALVGSDGAATLYNRGNDSIILGKIALPDDHPILLARFFRLQQENASATYFSIVTAGGRAVTVCIESGLAKVASLTQVPILGAGLVEYAPSKSEKMLCVASDEAHLVSFKFEGGSWKQHLSQKLPVKISSGRLIDPVYIGSPSDGGMDTMFIMASTWLILVRSSTLTIVDKITSAKLAQTQGSLMLGQASACSSCGGSAVRSFAVACGGTHVSECKLVAILPPKGDAESFCLRNTNPSCSRLANATISVISLPDAGNWLEPGAQSVLGLRKKQLYEPSERGSDSKQTQQLRYRRRRRSRAMSAAQDNSWEAYKLSLDGELETVDVPSEAEAGFNEPALFVNEAGPVVALNPQAVAVAFGNTVKVVRSVRRGSIGRSALAATPGRTSLDSRNT